VKVEKIIKNAVKCNECQEIVESRDTHDFNTHICKDRKKGADGFMFAVDGGKSYLRRVGDLNAFTDISEMVYVDIPDDPK
jgi:hypothetical protein